MNEEPTITTERIYSGRILNLRVDTVRLANGHTTQREIVEHGDAVAIVALDADGNVLLVRQFRKPVERNLLEIPAGCAEPGEEPLETARRELQEETGYIPGHLEHLATFYTTPGFCNETMHLYLATDLHSSRLTADDDEAIELVRMSISRIKELIASHEIGDAKTLVGLLIYVSRSRFQVGGETT